MSMDLGAQQWYDFQNCTCMHAQSFQLRPPIIVIGGQTGEHIHRLHSGDYRRVHQEQLNPALAMAAVISNKPFGTNLDRISIVWDVS